MERIKINKFYFNHSENQKGLVDYKDYTIQCLHSMTEIYNDIVGIDV